jgi:indolepyruvate ferredoxin oxidoreductase
VVTVGAFITMAAHLEGKSASVLDFMGFAQKGGSVLSFVRLADVPSRLNQVRIDTQQADAILACDLVVGASADALATVRHGRTRILANTHEVPVAESLRNPDASLKVPQLLEKLRFAAGADRLETLDAQALAEAFLGDSIVSNILALGYAWQRGLVPVGARRCCAPSSSMASGSTTTSWRSRSAAWPPADPQAVTSLLHEPAGRSARHRNARGAGAPRRAAPHRLPGPRLCAPLRRLRRPGAGARGVARRRSVAAVHARRGAQPAQADGLQGRVRGGAPVHRRRVPAHACGSSSRATTAWSSTWRRPSSAARRMARPPRKVRLGGWMFQAMKLLALGRPLRGTVWDVFGYTDERRLERSLVREYRRRIEALLPALSPEKLAVATDIAALPQSMRGFGHVKQANVALARVREAELLHRFDPATYPRPAGRGAGRTTEGDPGDGGGLKHPSHGMSPARRSKASRIATFKLRFVSRRLLRPQRSPNAGRAAVDGHFPARHPARAAGPAAPAGRRARVLDRTAAAEVGRRRMPPACCGSRASWACGPTDARPSACMTRCARCPRR